MRNILIAGLALISFGVSDGLAAVPDTARAGSGVHPSDEAPAQEPREGAPSLARDHVLYGDAGQDDEPQGRSSQDRYPQDRYEQDGYGRTGRQRALDVRVWLEGSHDVFRAGERTRVLVQANQDAYVAVLHINPRGDVEFLWPRDYTDEGYLDGGVTHALGERGSRWLSVSGVYGIGYVFAVASDEPMDTRRFRDYYTRRTVGWDRRLNVYGDPFYAMERFERLLVGGDWDYGYHASDYASYHVGSRYPYPRYACYSDYGPWYTSTGAYYGGCDVVRVLLRDRPYYYDTRYYHGDRSRYYRRYYRYDDYRVSAPRHRYKERTDGGRSTATGSPNRRPWVAQVPPLRTGSEAYQQQQERDRDRGDQEGGRAQQPTRQRPTLQRRPPESEPARRGGSSGGSTREEEPRRESPPPRRAEPRERDRDEPRSVGGRSRDAEPRRESPPARRAEPRESPPSRAEPRRESPPSRGGGDSPRSTPSEGSRVRPSSEG